MIFDRGATLEASGFLVGPAVFKAVEAAHCVAWWVRFPSASVGSSGSRVDIVLTRADRTSRNHNKTLTALFVGTVLSLVGGALVILGEYLCVSPHGAPIFGGFAFLLALPLLASVGMIPVTLACCISPRLRPLAMRLLIVCVMFSSVVIASFSIGRRVRMNGFRALAKRSRPLVAAIGTYERERGAPPPSLEALVPGYVPSVPTTGMGAYPKYEYLVGERAEAYGGNTWVLRVFTPSGVLNFDRFVYYPNQNYRDTCLGRVERVEDWAYLHE